MNKLIVNFQNVGSENLDWSESFDLNESGDLCDDLAIEKAVAAKVGRGALELSVDFVNETDGVIYEDGFEVAIGEFFSREELHGECDGCGGTGRLTVINCAPVAGACLCAECATVTDGKAVQS